MSTATAIPIRRRPPRPARRPVPPRVPRTPRVPVLAVLHPDGFVEIFGKNLSVHTALMLDGEGVPTAEILASEYLAAGLPRRFQELYYPEKPAATGMCERRGPESELSRLRELQIIHALRDIREAKTRQAQRDRAARPATTANSKVPKAIARANAQSRRRARR